jgi:2-polyprenyl-3-methyl-5-hydroxy-6-metoxy-1,4-benzoquinol methylase
MKDFNLYSKEHIQFIERDLPHLLRKAIGNTGPRILLDIGCGDGRAVIPLTDSYRETIVIGMDLSLLRLERIRSECNHLSLIQADADRVLPFKPATIHFVVCSQLVEHLKNDSFFLEQLYTILSREATLFLSTVYKKNWSWWIYKANGKRVCDPTHVYEYESQQELIDKIKAACLTVQKIRVLPLRVSILRNMVRLMVKYGVLHEKKARSIMDNTFFQALARYIFCPVPGYRIIEVICQRI